MVDGLSQQLGELLVVEDLEATAAGDLADGGGVEAVVVVAVSTLDEDAGVAQALGIDLSPHVVQMHAYRQGTQRHMKPAAGWTGSRQCCNSLGRMFM